MLAKRAAVILASAAGESVRAISARTGVSQVTACIW
ncbi:MAG: helix-turn-helix domain-containing protein, partial [Thermoanaerobaculia bacterium]